MEVLLIILCALVGTIALLTLCGCARWSFIYLLRCRLLKREAAQARYVLSTKNDIKAAIIAALTLAIVVILLIYGLPFVAEHISELPERLAPPSNGGV